MRMLSARRNVHHEEEESVFVSMTDMTVSFLFIVMILLAFFASRFNAEEMVPLDVYEPVEQERDALLVSLRGTEDRLSLALAQIAELTEERTALIEDLEQVEAERDTLLRLVEDLKTRLAASEEQLTEAIARIDALRTALIKAETTLEETRAVAADRQNRIAELEAEIAALAAEIARLRRPDPLKTYLSQVAAQREQVLRRLRESLLADFPELEGVITSESDVLRFQGEGLFASGSDGILRNRIPIVERIAERLDALLPCYTLGTRAAYSQDCNPAFAVIEAVQIEGHTDSDGADALNVALSAQRGAATYAAMTVHVPDLVAHLNLAGQPVMSIAGYGEGRPVKDNDTVEGKSTNRRIDLRFIMVTPGESAEIDRIRRRLSDRGGPR